MLGRDVLSEKGIMIEPVRILFVAVPDDARATATVRALADIEVETVANVTDAHDHLEAVDCVVCASDIPDVDAVSFFEEVQTGHPSFPCLLFGDVDDDVRQEMFDRNLADWVPATGGEQALANRLERIAEEIRQNRRLEAVRDASETMTNAETEVVVAETAAEVAWSVLGYSTAIVARYDSDDGALRPVAWSGVSDPDDRLFDTDGGLAWTAFLEDEACEGRRNGETEGEQWFALPLGRHGVLIVAQESDVDRGGTTVALAEMLAANAESAFARLDRKGELSTRSAALTSAETALERARRRESVVRDVLAAIIESGTRTEIEHTVCERLTNADQYRFAWIGEYDAATDEVTPRTWVGDEQTFLNELTTSGDDAMETTAWEAVRTREPTVDADLLGDPPYESWRQEALKRGYRSAISVPLTYRGTVYGVLTVYASKPDTFDEMERSVLEDVGKAVAYAINAVESKRALVSNSAVELEFRVRDPQFTVIEFVQLVDCRFEFESVIRETDDTLRLFFTTEGTTPEAVLSFTDQSLVVNDIRHITSRGDTDLFECTVSGSNVISLLLDHGAIPKAATAEGDEARLTIELPQTVDVRRFVETFQNRYENTELVARRKRDRPVQTEHDFRRELKRRLTDRQSEALETAYWSGFFEWPRESNGQEIAESLGVSQPTFNRHLRAAERNLLTTLFEDR